MSKFKSVIFATGLCFSLASSYAAEGDSRAMNHLRHAKAEIFEKMAICLKSDRSEANCEQELQENCEKLGGMKQCGMASADTAHKGKKMAKKLGSAKPGGSMGGMGGGMMGHDKMGGMGTPPAQDPMPDSKGTGSMPPMEPGDM